MTEFTSESGQITSHNDLQITPSSVQNSEQNGNTNAILISVPNLELSEGDHIEAEINNDFIEVQNQKGNDAVKTENEADVNGPSEQLSKGDIEAVMHHNFIDVQNQKENDAVKTENEADANGPSEQRKRKRGPSKKLERQKFIETKSKWSKSRFCFLDGHNDKVCSLASNKETLVSASKDTTCKVWDKHGKKLHTLGDHTSTVTGVFLLEDKICTISYDCKLRMWDTKSGKLEHSHYLFSPITCAVIFGKMALIGTGGGKIMYYCTETLAVKWETVGHLESVLSLALNEKLVVSASLVPDLCVWKISKDLLSVSTVPMTIPVTRPVRCMILHNEKLYFGDDGVNIKVFHFNSENMDKLKNHDTDHGSTDSMLIYKNCYLVSSSYNLDSGKSSINFRLLEDHSYLFTVRCPVYNPITCMSCDPSSSSDETLELFCGGFELGVIQPIRDQSAEYYEIEEVKVVQLEALRDRFVDSLSEAFSSDEEEVHSKAQRRESDVADEPGAPGSWCSIS
ncbi:uncharacterized protein LOC134814969 isoform X2 [Bolinopsis microptera]